MTDFTPENPPKPAETKRSLKKFAMDDLDGSQSIEEIVERHPGVPMVKLGKQAIKDAGKRLAQIQGLKPGSSSKRTPEMIDQLLDRLRAGETVTSICCDPHMPANSTLWYWCEADEALEAAIKKAQSVGQRVLADIRMDIAAGGTFSTGDVRRDAEFIKAINANIAQRNRAEFGERQQVSVEVGPAPVMLPSIFLTPKLIEVDDPEGD